MELIKDFAHGPLDVYRNAASFDWKRLRFLVEGEEVIKYKINAVNILKSNPIFHRSNVPQNLFGLRRTNDLRSKELSRYEEFNIMNFLDHPRLMIAYDETLLEYDPSLYGKHTISREFFVLFVVNLGNEAHMQVINDIYEHKAMGCFSMTEIGHGSNTKAIEARATFDEKSDGFILNTPHFEATKCWSGNMGRTATHACVFLQLYTSDGVCHGVHTFLVPIRDPKTLQSFPGVIVGDMGEKNGYNGLDNGFLIFDNYHIPRNALLSKHANISADGKYIRKTSSQPLGASLVMLSFTRCSTILNSSTFFTMAVVIAVRYAGVRKQFAADDDGAEVALLEYQLHQYRLVPLVAAAYILKVFATFIMEDIYLFNNNKKSEAEMAQIDPGKYGMETHAITASSKSVITWLTQAALQECREACGGHGYLKASRFGDMRNDNDGACTYEGDNNVLLQQTSNWLIKHWTLIEQHHEFSYPLHTVDFLTHAHDILATKFNECTNLESPQVILSLYEWLIVYLIKISYKNYEATLSSNGRNSFDAKNRNQVFHAMPLAKVYSHYCMLKTFEQFIESKQSDYGITKVLNKLLALHGLYHLEQHLAYFYQGGYFINSTTINNDTAACAIKRKILQLCGDLKNEVVSLMDAIAPDDFLLNSVLGNSDGQVYTHLKNYLFNKDSFSRPPWWQEILNHSKL